jgi:hypothetical protein
VQLGRACELAADMTMQVGEDRARVEAFAVIPSSAQRSVAATANGMVAVSDWP